MSRGDEIDRMRDDAKTQHRIRLRAEMAAHHARQDAWENGGREAWIEAHRPIDRDEEVPNSAHLTDPVVRPIMCEHCGGSGLARRTERRDFDDACHWCINAEESGRGC